VSTALDLGGFNAVAEAMSPFIYVRIPREGGHRFRSKPPTPCYAKQGDYIQIRSVPVVDSARMAKSASAAV
jgi:hypothetical protein